MKISKYFHSCILIEENNQRLLIDPGAFSFIEGLIKPEDFGHLDVVLITHAHSDHYDINALKVFKAVNPELKIVCNTDTGKVLGENGLDFDELVEGQRQIGDFKIESFLAEHLALPVVCPQNTAFVINDTFLHCGDSFDKSIMQHKVKVLASPIIGPFMTSVMGIEFVKSYGPEKYIPIHDRHIKDFSLDGLYQIYSKELSSQNIDLIPLRNAGDSAEIK